MLNLQHDKNCKVKARTGGRDGKISLVTTGRVVMATLQKVRLVTQHVEARRP